MEINKPVEQVILDKTSDIKSRIFAQIRMVITFLLMLALLFIILVKLDAKNNFDDDFWLKFIVGLFLNIAMLIIWVPSGKESGEKYEAYKSNKKLAAEKVSSILGSAQKTNNLDVFCAYANEENRETIIKSMLSRRGIKYQNYLNIYCNMTAAEIKRSKKLSFAQKRVILSVRKGVKVRQIFSSQITSLSNNAGEIFSVKNEEKNAQTFRTVIKIVSSIVMAVIIAYMTFAVQDKITIASFTQFFIWVGTMVFNIFTSHQMGYGLVTVQRNAYHLRLIDFCSRFDAWLAREKKDEGKKD